MLRCADPLAATGMEPRTRLICLILSVSTLSHHHERLKNEELVRVRCHGVSLRYSANKETLGELLKFVVAECWRGDRESEPREAARAAHARKGHRVWEKTAHWKQE